MSSDKALSRADLAGLLDVSEARIQQLTGAGVLKRRKGGYDPLESAVAFAKWLRRDEETKRARLRLLTAQAMNHERRLRQHLRKLLTVDELHDALLVAFEEGAGMVQRETSRLFHERAAVVGEDRARLDVHPIYTEFMRLLRGYRNGCDALADALRSGLVQDEARIDRLMEDFRQSVAAKLADEDVPTLEAAG
jgi:phage terminase Nu1 subunit (DNA packaging protein)